MYYLFSAPTIFATPKLHIISSYNSTSRKPEIPLFPLHRSSPFSPLLHTPSFLHESAFLSISPPPLPTLAHPCPHSPSLKCMPICCSSPEPKLSYPSSTANRNAFCSCKLPLPLSTSHQVFSFFFFFLSNRLPFLEPFHIIFYFAFSFYPLTDRFACLAVGLHFLPFSLLSITQTT